MLKNTQFHYDQLCANSNHNGHYHALTKMTNMENDENKISKTM